MRGFLIGLLSGVVGGIVGSSVIGFDILGANEESEAQPPVQPERPAYMLVLGEVHDRAAFGQGYAAKLPPLYDRFGGAYIGIGGGVEVLEGDYAPESFVIGKWPSKSAALAFWNSPEYDELRRARIDNEWGTFDVLLVEGLPAPVQAAPGVSDREK
ncbi:MAG: DUF1330 domain-containing protein [Pseudomonadota bacterium]